mmetsp:Transcript_23241/g.41579  ORF Transcript_23241/g.41579 Transcript_23241/m.41579 type:complete len:140 (+) Transcript_23241:98-517(+)
MVEVHIPKKGVWGRLQPAPKEEDDDLPDDMNALRELEEHESTALLHLERSNEELLVELEDEEDADFRDAVRENLQVMEIKRKRLDEVRGKIRKIELAANRCSAGGPVGKGRGKGDGGYGAGGPQLADVPVQAMPEGLDL